MILKTIAILMIFTVGKMQASDAEVIRQARLDQNYSLAAGDIERAAAFWTEDITMRRGLGDAVIGKEAYRAIFKSVRDEKGLIFVREPEVIEVSEDWPLAYESGIWTGRREGAVVISGRYAAQWVKQEGYWLIRSEVFVALINSEAP